MPEAVWHERVLAFLRALLDSWLAATGRNAVVYRNVAIRLRADRPQVGFDPDLCIVEPRPPDAYDLDSLCLWKPGHRAPRFVVEVVSPSHPYKDYVNIPARCAALGVEELVVFDPRLAGPSSVGGPFLLQVWRRTAECTFERVSAGQAPSRSEFLDAWLVPAPDGTLLIADDAAGKNLWQTEPERLAARIRQLETDLAARDESSSRGG